MNINIKKIHFNDIIEVLEYIPDNNIIEEQSKERVKYPKIHLKEIKLVISRKKINQCHISTKILLNIYDNNLKLLKSFNPDLIDFIYNNTFLCNFVCPKKQHRLHLEVLIDNRLFLTLMFDYDEIYENKVTEIRDFFTGSIIFIHTS